jgi:uncharacterized membrane protein YwzB
MSKKREIEKQQINWYLVLIIFLGDIISNFFIKLLNKY